MFEIVDTESLVPANHLLRKIDAAVDFGKIYDMVEPLYCADNGRPSVDPVVLFKMVLIQHLYGLTSLRRTAEEVRGNIYRPMTMKGGHEWWKYVYDAFYDCVICPEYQVLNYSTTNRDGYREYKSDPKICANCPTRHLCTKSKDCVKTVTRHIWKDYEELADDARYTPIYQRMYKARKETIERVFADAKEQHGLRYTRYTGLAQVTNWVKLKFAAMNLKKYAKWVWRDRYPDRFSCIISLVFPFFRTNPSFA